MPKKLKKRQIPPKFELEKPTFTEKEKKKMMDNLVDYFFDDKSKDKYDRANEPVYLYWDKVKYKQPPEQITIKEFWFLISQVRKLSSKKTVIRTENGVPFTWLRLNYTDEFLHIIDTHSGGEIFASDSVAANEESRQLITRGILEEAIASSQLEGAHTTRAVAKKMILEKRKPRNESERMILNNYHAITAIESDYKNWPMSKELLYEMHRVITKDTVAEEERGRFRKNTDEIVVQGEIKREVYTAHIPPNEVFLENEIERFIQYANDDLEESFTHPVIKAIFLHFWIGYLHPFTDGNGRLARAIFYWYLLRKNYWMLMYMPISKIIKNAPHQYAMAYIYSEQDGNDITYFYDFHIRKILQSLREFKAYLNLQKNKNKKIESVLSTKYVLNDRQKQLIHYLIDAKDGSFTTNSHKTLHGVSRQTATKDLKELERYKLIIGVREGKGIRYYSTKKLQNLVL